MKASELKRIIKEEIARVLKEEMEMVYNNAKQYTGSDLQAKQMLAKKFGAKLRYNGINVPQGNMGIYFPDFIDPRDNESEGECVGILVGDKFYIGVVEMLGNLPKASGVLTRDPKQISDQLVSGKLKGFLIPAVK